MPGHQVAAVLCVSSLVAQGLSYRTIPSAMAPAPRCAHAMFFDRLAGNFVLFGGFGASSFADTWTWDAANGWIQRQPPHSPPAGQVYTSFVRANGECIVFSQANSLWRWTGSDWVLVPTSGQTPPPINYNPDWEGSAWDGDRDVLVHVIQSSVYELSGTIWTNRNATGPGTGDLAPYAAAAWMPGRGIMMHGGISFAAGPTPTFPVSTWLWDGTAWTRLAATGPNGYQRHLMAWHPARQRMVMVTTAYQFLEWQESSSSWLQVGTAPLYQSHVWVPLVYDPMQERLLTFGTGYYLSPTSQFDALESNTPARADGLGAGCAGSAGTPVLDAAFARPWLGDPFTVALGPVPPATGLFWTFSLARTTWGGMPVPVDLGPLGMPGCFVQSGPEAVDFTVASPAGRGGRTFHVDAHVLGGLQWYLQAGVMDPSVNALGAVVSNGLALQFGLR